MRSNTELVILRVFVNERGEFGNPVGIVPDGSAVPSDARQQVAKRLGLSETVFIDDVARGELAVYTPEERMGVVGHPLVGASWLLRSLGRSGTTLRSAGHEIATWTEGDSTWIRAALRFTPPWWHERLPSVEDVERLTLPSPDLDAVQFWAWIDEGKGVVRARVFASRYGVEEDEACGSSSMRLAAALGRALRIRHGAGSTVCARPAYPGYAEVGGLVRYDETVPLEGRMR
jgi:predicted PhzF superfamily epimerase YddE/YHI9